MDKALRNMLRNVVTQCRKELEKSVAEMLEGQFGIYASGKIDDATAMGHLSAEDQEYRSQLLVHLEHIQAGGFKAKDAAEQLIREVAFTHLNRFCAYKMMEVRKLIRESVSRGYASNYVKFYLAEHPEDERLYNAGQQATAYRHFLEWLGGTLSEEIGVLFSPHDPANRLLPPQRVLDQVLELLNSEALKDIWAEDETIGWIYQYFTPKELRDQARKESKAPRNSYELAFRNQFYTPSYVVQFLTDNTLGRIWYEMRQGETALKELCQYMVCRPNEVFLVEGEEPPEEIQADESLSQEELLQQPVYIAYRKLKDPREIRVLDPACGSGHFLLYCFTLLLTIYEEAWDVCPEVLCDLRDSGVSKESFMQQVPGLILAHNLHGIDIDIRATQIAALALWLRVQRAYQEMGLKKNRPKITKSNVVCAEPMPGDKSLLEEFIADLQPTVLGQLVQAVFNKMKLVGEAGSLLKIEEEIRDVITEAKNQWKAQPKAKQLALLPDLNSKPTQLNVFDFSRITDEEFWNEAEARVVEALQEYAQRAVNSQRLQRLLFADDVVQGFAFIDICRKNFDVSLMNPPFGAVSKNSKSYIESVYPQTKGDILTAFVERSLEWISPDGLIGIISSRTCFFLGTASDFREQVLSEEGQVLYLADLGDGVLEAMVETAAYILNKNNRNTSSIFFRNLLQIEKSSSLLQMIQKVNLGRYDENLFITDTNNFSKLFGSPYAYWVDREVIEKLGQFAPLEGHFGKVKVGLQTSKDERFLRLIWEVSPLKIGFIFGYEHLSLEEFVTQIRMSFRQDKQWAFYSKTDAASPWLSPLTLVVNWDEDGDVIKDYVRSLGDSPSRSVRSEDLYFKPGFSYMLRSTRLVPYIVPSGVIPTAGRAQAYPDKNYEFTLLGFCASNIASAVARFSGEMFARPKFQASMVQNLPVPDFPTELVKQLSSKIEFEVKIRRLLLQGIEPYQEFIRPLFLDDLVETLAETPTTWNLISLLGDDLELKIAKAFDISEHQLRELERDIREAVAIRDISFSDSEENDEDDEANGIEFADVDLYSKTAGLLSYAMGSVLGKWDIRIAKNKTLAPQSNSAFDPPPLCPPGTLVGSNGLPANSGSIVSEDWLSARPSTSSLPEISTIKKPIIRDSEYPISIDWDGILVDDSEHSNDIIRRVRDVLEFLFQDEADKVEQEIRSTLEVRSLRDYFRKTGNNGFWQDHINNSSDSF